MKTFKQFENINENHNFTNEAANGLKGVKELRNGLSVEIIKDRYPWLMQAKFKNAVIGKDLYGLIVWYKGTWIDGTWYAGTWEDGIWESGTWFDGTWKKGTWLDGTWQGGIWESGTWESGTWKDGWWYDGSWFDGTWHTGLWYSGLWYDGTWEKGRILNKKTNKFKNSKNPPQE